MRIRKRVYESGETVWQLDCGVIDGKRVRLVFPSEAAAQVERDERMRRLHRHGHASFSLTDGERIRFAEARDRLAAVGATIEQAVEHFLATKPVLRPAVTMKRLLELCLQEKELLGLRPHSLRQLACSCGNFVAGREMRDPASVTRDEVKAWVLGNKWAPKTQRNYLGDLRTLFSWAKSERYVSRNPCADGDEIKLAAVTEGDVEILSPEQCEKLLLTALTWRGPMFDRSMQGWEDGWRYLPLLGYAALAMFVGIRPEELARSTRDELDLGAGSFLVMGGRAKTRARRVVNLPWAARGWLEIWAELCPGRWIIPPNFKRLWLGLRTAAGLSYWPHDVLRHTAASMHYMRHQDAPGLRSMLGHSQGEDTLFQHYRGVRLPSGRPLTWQDAERFYRCVRPGLVTDL